MGHIGVRAVPSMNVTATALGRLPQRERMTSNAFTQFAIRRRNDCYPSRSINISDILKPIPQEVSGALNLLNLISPPSGTRIPGNIVSLRGGFLLGS